MVEDKKIERLANHHVGDGIVVVGDMTQLEESMSRDAMLLPV
jgi:hypothetical protein